MNVIGQKFGKLFVIKKSNEKAKNNGEYKYECICDCGRIILVRGSNLKNGNSTQCKYCCKKIRTSKKLRHKNIRLNTIYNNMKQRCYYKNYSQYKDYGGRGIQICEEWLNSYDNFYNWAINNGYNNNLTIDRINVNGNYEPNNCKWSTKQEQSYNKRNTVFITYKEKTKCLSEWAKILNVFPTTLKCYINKYGIETAFKKLKKKGT